MSKRPFEAADDAAWPAGKLVVALEGLDAPQPQASESKAAATLPRFMPCQWPEDESDIDPISLQATLDSAAPSSFFDTLASTLAKIKGLFSIPESFRARFLRKQIVIAEPVVNDDGSRKKRIIDAGFIETHTPTKSLGTVTDNGLGNDVDMDWSVDEIIASSTPPATPSPAKTAVCSTSAKENSPQKSPSSSIKGPSTPIKSPSSPVKGPSTPIRLKMRFRGFEQPRKYFVTPKKEPPLPDSPSPPPLRKVQTPKPILKGTFTPVQKELFKPAQKGFFRSAQRELFKPVRKELINPAQKELSPPPSLGKFFSPSTKQERMDFMNSFLNAQDEDNQYQDAGYENDLGELPDAPTPPVKKQVRMKDVCFVKPFFFDKSVIEMLDTTLEAIKKVPSPLMVHRTVLAAPDEGDEVDEPEVDPVDPPPPSFEQSPEEPSGVEQLPASSTESSESTGFRGVPEDIWNESYEENSLDESQLSSEFLSDLQDDLKNKLAIEEAPTPAVTPPVPVVTPPAPVVTPPVLPLVPTLTETDEEFLLGTAGVSLMPGEDERLSTDKRLGAHDFKTILPQLFRGDPSAWLNDAIVNDYLTLLVDKIKNDAQFKHKKGGPAPPVHAFPSQWFVSAQSKIDNFVRWASKKQLGGEQFLDAKLVLLPICDVGHWRLIAVKPQERTVEYLDSMAKPAARYVDVAMQCIRAVLDDRFDESEWTVLPSQRSVRQINGSDCGVFTLLNALTLLRGEEPSRVKADDGMDDARKQIAVTLLNSEIRWEFAGAKGL